MHWTRFLDDPALADFLAREEDGARVLVRLGYETWVGMMGIAGGRPRAEGSVEGGRQAHPVVALPGGDRAVVRRYLRGGAIRHLNRSRYFGGHRAFEELRATERARAAGVRVPLTLAAAERPRRLGYGASIVTRWIADASELHGWLLDRRDSAEAASAVLREAGRQVGLLHAGGVAHPDLNLRNLLVSPSDAGDGAVVTLLDLDRARLFAAAVPRARRARDLKRLARSARKLSAPVPPGGWKAFRDGYGDAWPLSSALG